MIHILIAYLVIAALWATAAGVLVLFALYPEDQRTPARFLLLAPVWPVGVVILLYRAVRTVIRAADLGDLFRKARS